MHILDNFESTTCDGGAHPVNFRLNILIRVLLAANPTLVLVDAGENFSIQIMWSQMKDLECNP